MYVVFLVGAGVGVASEVEADLKMTNIASARATDKTPIMARRKYFVLSLLGLGSMHFLLPPHFMQKLELLLFSVPQKVHLHILFSSL
ncbi:MAG: hypothetical protein Q4C32_01445 [Eubacteriales bacterium]|nr:hypothetical protein [Eubacteriales bacterium]